MIPSIIIFFLKSKTIVGIFLILFLIQKIKFFSIFIEKNKILIFFSIFNIVFFIILQELLNFE
ncbi:hypothetical protein MEJ66_00235 [Candidatus Carsonella ruddii]|nr:hypothetical protein [Candidatus Carsonella ruddii]WGS66711.1 hypothetical protein MEJ66_00235 [Candidatus Carsonella ruddii]